MALKKYNISQVVTLNGAITTSSFQVRLEAADLPNFLALLEGGYKVTVEDPALTNMAASDTAVTVVNKVSRIAMYGADADGDSLYSGIKPFKGSIMFKNTVDSDALTAVLQAVTPFKNSIEKPTTVSANFVERAVATA